MYNSESVPKNKEKEKRTLYLLGSFILELLACLEWIRLTSWGYLIWYKFGSFELYKLIIIVSFYIVSMFNETLRNMSGG
jgi:hypothetical protein